MFILYINDIAFTTQHCNIGLNADVSTLYKSDYDLFKVEMNLHKSVYAIDNWCKTKQHDAQPRKYYINANNYGFETQDFNKQFNPSRFTY